MLTILRGRGRVQSSGRGRGHIGEHDNYSHNNIPKLLERVISSLSSVRARDSTSANGHNQWPEDDDDFTSYWYCSCSVPWFSRSQ